MNQGRGKNDRRRLGAEDDGLTQPALEDERHQSEDEIIWGIHPVWEALRQPTCRVHEVLVQRGRSNPKIQQIIEATRSQAISLRFTELNRSPMPRDCRHQGVAARLSAYSFLSLDELLHTPGQPLEAKHAPNMLLLDCMQDPRNVGSIFRSALAAGFSRIIVPRDRSAAIGATVAKSSAGALNHVALAQVVNVRQTLNTLKQAGFWIFGAVADQEAASIYQTDFPPALCLVIGGEAKGIRPLVREHCDQLITIPMLSDFNSLNASAAAAVIMFEILRRQRFLNL